MLANGLGCLAKTECLSTSWLAALRDNFKTRSKHLRLRDFFLWRRRATSPTSREADAVSYPTAHIGSDCTLTS